MNPLIFHSEAELVALLKSKDEKAFSYLYDNYAAALYGVVFKVLDKDTPAGDVLQEVFVKIWRGIGQYDAGKGRLYTWMLNIARNAAIDIRRSGSFRKDQKTTDIEQGVSIQDSRHTTGTNTDAIGLKQSVMNLKQEFRILIDMAYFQGYTQEEISKALNIPLGTVKTRMRHAIIALKSVFK